MRTVFVGIADLELNKEAQDCTVFVGFIETNTWTKCNTWDISEGQTYWRSSYYSCSEPVLGNAIMIKDTGPMYITEVMAYEYEQVNFNYYYFEGLD